MIGMKRVIFLMTIVLFALIYNGCTKDNMEAVDNRKEVADDLSKQDGLKSEADSSKVKEEGETQAGKSTGEEANSSDVKKNISEDGSSLDDSDTEDKSPWKLISESSVETKVEYAGFFNDTIGIAVGYAGETSYTGDGGKSWTKSDNVSACRYGLDIYDEDFIISSGNSGVNLLSNDKGKTWTKLGDFPLKPGGDYNKFMSIADKNNIYIGSNKSLGISTDQGMTWQELDIPDGCNNIVGMYFMTPDIGYLLNTDGSLFITKDACETWTKQAIDLSGEKIAYSKMPSVAINFQDEDHGMIIYSTMSYKVYCIRTEDGGKTWEIVAMPKVKCFAPYISRDGRYLTLSSTIKKICLYELEEE